MSITTSAISRQRTAQALIDVEALLKNAREIDVVTCEGVTWFRDGEHWERA